MITREPIYSKKTQRKSCCQIIGCYNVSTHTELNRLSCPYFTQTVPLQIFSSDTEHNAEEIFNKVSYEKSLKDEHEYL